MPALNAPYKNRRLPIDRRVHDLLGRMSLEEKVAQLKSMWKDPVMDNCAKLNGDFNAKKARKVMAHGFGTMSAVFRTFTPEHGVKVANEIQKFLLEKTRLGIPVFHDAEGLHGSFCVGSTCFPQAVGLAATWRPDLARQMAVAVAREVKSRGMHIVLSPVLDIARDVRCGRVEETYGEDPYLVTLFGVAFIKGVQSQRVIATPKHFVANFVGDGGRDSNPIHMSERMLREIYLPPFEAAFKDAKALSVMAAYHSIDGTPCNAHPWLLTDLLRKEYGFAGHVVSDWFAVAIMHTHHKTAATVEEAGKPALLAGMDVELPFTNGFKDILRQVQAGEIPLKVLDEAVRRILRNKFWAGLFDQPYRDPAQAVAINGSKEHRQLALDIARQVPVLLKNDGNLLPLRKTLQRIAVIGPNAAIARLGGYPTTEAVGVSPLQGLKKFLGQGTEILYAEGCKLKGGTTRGIPAAVKAARKADVVILCVGNCAYETEGEGSDRSNLDLPGHQQELLLAVAKANPKTVVVLNGGSAVTMEAWLAKVPAILDIFFLGHETGQALAEILFGTVNPGGKLPFTFPVRTGQCPLYYNHKPTGRSLDYNDLRGRQPQFPFGFGLSYTSFKFSNLRVTRKGSGRNLQVNVQATVSNTGRRAGDEVVQLYIHDEYADLSRPVKELKRFARLTIPKGGGAKVEFHVTAKDFMYLGPKLKPVLEPGNFEILLGDSSENLPLKYVLKL